MIGEIEAYKRKGIEYTHNGWTIAVEAAYADETAHSRVARV